MNSSSTADQRMLANIARIAAAAERIADALEGGSTPNKPDAYLGMVGELRGRNAQDDIAREPGDPA